MKENRNGFIILTTFLLILLAGLVIVISPLDKKVDYFASGEIQLNQTQWQEFKTDCYKDKTDISTVVVLDSGEQILVQFNDLCVDKNFPFGTIKHTDGKANNSMGQIIEALCIAIGGIGEFATLMSFE